MILFLIKKTFFDFWDNLLFIILLNIGFLLIFLGEIYSFGLFFNLGLSIFENTPILFFLFIYACATIGCVVFSVYTGTIAKTVKKIADFDTPKFHDLVINLKETYKASSIFAVALVTYAFVFLVAGKFYLNSKIIISGFNIGIIVFTLLVMMSFLIVLASQYFFPLQATFDLNVKKNIKKMFLILYDNTGFTILLFIFNTVVIALSTLTFFIFFGITVNLLLCMVALKLRLYKYDYYEKHPDYTTRRIPWDELLSEDRKMVGKRTLKGMIFPWKK